ncbi:MAG: sulfite dehydrogenase [Gammaproteobacteria bacterium]|nr:MAG: sulfite dehydrogenase [Gammaproteobacteria bacterium]
MRDDKDTKNSGDKLSRLVFDRRRFLGSGLLGGLAALAGGRRAEADGLSTSQLVVPPWSHRPGPGVATRAYGQPSPYEKSVIRRFLPWIRPTREASVSFTPLQDLHGIITPNGLFFERHHAGTPEIDPQQHRLVIHGMVEQPLVFRVDELMRFPSVSRIHFIECAGNGAMEQHGAMHNALQFTHGMLSCAEWTGVPLRYLLREAGIRKGARWLLAEGADAAGLARSFPIEKAMDDALIVYAQNGEPLRPEQGYPLRLLLPGWEGVANVKWLRRLEVGDRPWETREETATYTDLLPSGKARQFTFVQEAKSVITSPCPERPMPGRGRFMVEGLAWSGAGRIKAVDVSFDGGRNWRSARLKGLVLDKALTRFEIEWNWQGGQALLQSRAIDETGYVQPTLGQLRAVRGMNSMYHNNAIQTWLIHPSGEVENVQLDV